MTDDPELDRVRMVLDFTPAEVYDEFPEQERKLLESLDSRLDRTVAVKKRDRVRVVVERPGTDRERVREYHPPTSGPAADEGSAKSGETVRHEVLVKEVGRDEPAEADEPEEPSEAKEPDVPQEIVLEEVEVADTAEPRGMELDLDEPPEPYAPAEPSEVHRESETEWPDPDQRYEELHGQDLETEDEEPAAPAWPDAPEDEPEIWPEEPVEEPSTGDLGGFEDVSVSPSEPAEASEPDEPADESELGWPGVDDEPAQPAADEPAGFEDAGTPEPFEPETTGEEPSDERDAWIEDSFAGEESEAADVSATDESTADDEVIQKSFPPGTTREEIEEWAREHGYRIRNIERDDED